MLSNIAECRNSRIPKINSRISKINSRISRINSRIHKIKSRIPKQIHLGILGFKKLYSPIPAFSADAGFVGS